MTYPCFRDAGKVQERYRLLFLIDEGSDKGMGIVVLIHVGLRASGNPTGRPNRDPVGGRSGHGEDLRRLNYF